MHPKPAVYFKYPYIQGRPDSLNESCRGEASELLAAMMRQKPGPLSEGFL